MYAVVAAAVVAGIGVALWPGPSSGRSEPHATVTLASPAQNSVVCSATGGPEYFLVSFAVEGVSANVSTANFAVGLVSPEGAPIPANDSAPPPLSSLPCGAPDPPGWYAIYSAGARGPWATFPYATDDWSNGSSAPIALSNLGWFDIVSSSDLTGSLDVLHAYGVGGANVTFAGDTTFPPYHGP